MSHVTPEHNRPQEGEEPDDPFPHKEPTRLPHNLKTVIGSNPTTGLQKDMQTLAGYDKSPLVNPTTGDPKPIPMGEWTKEDIKGRRTDYVADAHNAALAAAWRKGHADAQSPALERIDELHQQLAAEKALTQAAIKEATGYLDKLAAERERAADDYIELCDKANGDMIALNNQLAAEREVGGNTAIALAQQITKLEDALSRITLNGDYYSAQEARMALGVEPPPLHTKD